MLTSMGLVADDTLKDLIKQFDQDGDGQISQEEFLEMMCPDGFRAHPEATRVYEVMNGRFFARNKIIASWIDEAAYDKKMKLR